MNQRLRDSLETVFPRSLKTFAEPVLGLIRSRLWLQILVSMFLGIGAGILLSPEMGFVSSKTSSTIGEWVGLPGQVFLALIQMIVVPLILASIIRGICSASDIQQLKSTGLWVGAYFLITTIIAVTIGIGTALIVQPGKYVDSAGLTKSKVEVEVTPLEAASDEAPGVSLREVPGQLTEILPKNPMSSIVEGEMLQIVIFAIIIGIGLLLLPLASARPLLEIFGSIQEVCMAIVGAVMRIAPIAVFGLLTQAMIRSGPSVLTGLGIYTLSVVAGMAVLFIVYVSIGRFLGGKKFGETVQGVREPFLLGFSTNSSAATMPVTVKSAEEKLKVRSSIAQFIVPLGATINMGGTALYQGLATVFMAQIYDLDLSIAQLVALVATAVGASIGTPAVPGVGIVVLTSVLNSAGVPLGGLALIVGLDRILERFRTSLNVTGDLIACVVMDRFIPSGISKEAEEKKFKDLESKWSQGEPDVLVEESSPNC